MGRRRGTRRTHASVGWSRPDPPGFISGPAGHLVRRQRLCYPEGVRSRGSLCSRLCSSASRPHPRGSPRLRCQCRQALASTRRRASGPRCGSASSTSSAPISFPTRSLTRSTADSSIVRATVRYSIHRGGGQAAPVASGASLHRQTLRPIIPESTSFRHLPLAAPLGVSELAKFRDDDLVARCSSDLNVTRRRQVSRAASRHEAPYWVLTGYA